ncbi:acid phosphatase, class B-like, HAD-like domain protein [Artemisia annua]|uniref:Acid phosphatase, class B-like, HAD-like domain protein n=1 Tax=Artemisia annua TaxID=35608 RepID=A0A2U1PA98_ARTAN|nr:acid phosphatase, class B-like, HAD-like domain protein [Artemisia annua]
MSLETNNIQKWKQVPEECETYIGHYMLGEQYRKDVDLVTEEAYEYAKGLNVTKDGKDVWVFDIDDYASDAVAFGAIP